MLEQVLENLKTNELISERNVEDFRRYIRDRNPHAPGRLFSSIFADALYRALDARLGPFADADRKRIREKVVRKAVAKDRFSVNGAEVLRACIALGDSGEAFCESLTQWVCLNQPVEVDRLLVKNITEKLGQYDEAHLDLYFDGLINTLETPATAGAISPALSVMPFAAPPMAAPAVPPAASSALPTEAPERMAADFAAYFPGKRRKGLLAALAAVAAAFLLYMAAGSVLPEPAAQVQAVEIVAEQPEEKDAHDIGYMEVEKAQLKAWLDGRDSLLAEEPYFTAILDVSERYDVHPLLMFAITGQEQAFVPKSNKFSKKMANNPFNVYGSWERYNTDIRDAAELAAGLIARSNRSRPAGEDSIRWINKKYAEDPEWWIRVTSIFDQMKREILRDTDNQV